MSRFQGKARVWEEQVEIPTYEAGKPDKNPMFLDKRVYQGSSGRVYPHPVIDKIEDARTMKTYRMMILENTYLRIEIMPELGGRIYRAVDKTNNYDFVYYNRVIKPALVGLAGPWISGGIEFNWPQHHRPNTYGPVECKLEEHDDGRATVWVSEIDRMYGTKMTAAFTLYPDKAYLEIDAQLYNRTAQPQTFLWWANPAVAVNEHTQSVFPPDVTAVFDHGKRDVSKFPIATGTYYKMDYSAGVDISRYKNIPVPTSYMAYKSDFNFVGGYDHGVKAGLLHVANRHISPGKKQWTWGNGHFGQAWDRNLTDEDGPYIELMTGVYTDNQPDFAWLQPYETKAFKQYFMPYKDIGAVKNASIEATVNLEVDNAQATVQVYATSLFERATVELASKQKSYWKEVVSLSPELTFTATVPLTAGVEAHQLAVTVSDKSGRILVSYQPSQPSIEQVPDAAKPLPEPEQLLTIEELYLAGLHLEQYRHATFEPEVYYLEGLKRDKGDVRINVAYGTLLLRRGLLQESEAYFRTAIERLTCRNPNPYDSEAYYQLGVTLKLQGREDEAFTALYKAVWSAAWQDSGYFVLAQIAAGRGSFEEALELIERSLSRNTHNYKARHLKSAILRKLGRLEEAINWSRETIGMDIADFGAHQELRLALQASGDAAQAEQVCELLKGLLRGDAHNIIALASDYEGAGLYEEAINGLQVAVHDGLVYPMVHYTLGYLHGKLRQEQQALQSLKHGSLAKSDYCFPNTLFDLAVLKYAIDKQAEDAKAHYYIGNLLYDKKRPLEALAHWETSAELDPSFATVHRNLALAYFNKLNEPEKACVALDRAFACDSTDARVFYERDQLAKKLGVSPDERLARLEQHVELIRARDDLYLEYVTLHNVLKRHTTAIELIMERVFHPWEGGEGKIPAQYILANVELGKQLLRQRQYEDAIDHLHQALQYPDNIGEGKLLGAQENDIFYYMGCAFEGMGQDEQAINCFVVASKGLDQPTSAMYYNDQPPEQIFYQGLAWKKLHNDREANRRFHKLIDYAEKHLFDKVKIDYFAVSLPDFLVFEDDLDRRNEIHCRFMRGLGLLGLGKVAEAKQELEQVLRLDGHHQGAQIHLELQL
ncbi:MAG: DUF5107 domain-containing protein [Candidatus Cohnella colombiensis]|uniref:DUF5107 domain-containing protein n=1 Tax=Candidatus Cohnella colombiensis TaxID=3121368 RepID=A0AA95EXD7_9BACL|nr:MAG: DUF5107 domain-containing protein [Cohnella sp.]